MSCQIIILAAGNGSRMASDLPKVMHEVGGKPMIARVLSNTLAVTEDIVLVYSEQLKPHLAPYKEFCKFALQKQALGTAHAVYCVLDLIAEHVPVTVVYGDNPFISSSIIKKLLNHLISTNSAVSTLIFERNDPGQYGRIVTDKFGNLVKIVEFKHASEEEKKITLCNSGVMVFAPGILKKYIPYCVTPEQKLSSEFYLTSIIEICQNYNEKVSYLLSTDNQIVVGVNTQQELLEANNIIKTQHEV
ncbi:Pyrophosphorylase domain of GlmU-like protein [Candidatus Trichorickettsia mobilis]|uniref:Pyrophosphorylase domain of GlmU-like protein n=2 Tax=Candidatus Trichorickettsia mobilis TaxID=1346319 RepID=A0ABZ0URA3_9RICK|nr:Pyrophosphorylase domain of GlmU-like protein [Candidatus Trichorickettsia mobilis]